MLSFTSEEKLNIGIVNHLKHALQCCRKAIFLNLERDKNRHFEIDALYFYFFRNFFVLLSKIYSDGLKISNSY